MKNVQRTKVKNRPDANWRTSNGREAGKVKVKRLSATWERDAVLRADIARRACTSPRSNVRRNEDGNLLGTSANHGTSSTHK